MKSGSSSFFFLWFLQFIRLPLGPLLSCGKNKQRKKLTGAQKS